MSNLRSELDSVRCAQIMIRDYMRAQTRAHNQMISDGDMQIQKLEIQEEKLKSKIRKENAAS